MKLNTGILMLLLLNLSAAMAQITPTPAPGGFATKNPDVQVSTSTSTQHSEESIAIDKSNPLSIMVSSNTSEQGYWYSLDGGNTWTGSDDLPHNATTAGDPDVVFDAAGQSYLVGLGAISSVSTDGVWTETSTDNGVAWNSQVYIEGGPSTAVDGIDKPMSGAIDVMATSPYVNYFYSVWTNFDLNNNNGGSYALQFNRSTNGGTSFSTPINLKTGWGQGAVVETGPNGEVYAAWTDYTTTPTSIGFAADPTNGGTSFTVLDAFTETGYRSNGGATNFGGTRTNDFPSMAVDKSCGTHRGRIYIAYTDGYSNKSIDTVKVRYSDNHGSTWSSGIPISVNSSFKESWFPWIAVDDLTGLVNVIYFAEDQATGYTTDTYLSYSTDGASTWQTMKVSDVSHVPAAITGYAAGYCGDYLGVTSYGGHTYACWHDNRTGQWQVFVARIDFNIPLLYSSESSINVNAPDTLKGSITYQAGSSIVSTSNSASLTVAAGANITYKAGTVITLNEGFTAAASSNFLALTQSVASCQTPGELSLSHLPNLGAGNSNSDAPIGSAYSYPNPANGNITFALNDKAIEEDVVLQVRNISGQVVQTIAVEKQINGLYQVEYNTERLSAGVYFYSFISGKQSLTNKFVKIN